MAFTQVTCTGTITLGTGKPAVGALIEATPSAAMTNGGVTVSGPITTVTDSNGNFSFVLPANNDGGTTPSNTYYTVRVRVAGTGGGSDIYQQFGTVISSSSTTINLLNAARLTTTPGSTLYPDASYEGLFPEGWGSVISRSRSYSRGTAGYANFSQSSSGYNYLTGLTGLMTTYVFKVTTSATQLRVAYGAFCYGQDVGSTVPIGQATIEYPHASGNFYDLTFGGSGTVTLNNGQVVLSDAVDLSAVGGVVAGQLMNVRTWVPATSGLDIPTFDDKQTASGQADKISTAANQCHTTYSSVSDTSGGGFGPCGIFGNTNAASVALVGDSITQGVGDTAFPSAHVHAGWADRAFNNGTGLVSVARHAERGDQWFQNTLQHRRGLAYSCNRFICAYGNNDFYTATNLTTEQAQNAIIPIWRALKSKNNAKVWATTVTPRTTSTDSWATSTNQTPVANGAARIAYNQWMRDGAPIDINGQAAAVGSTGTFRAGDQRHPLTGVIDISSAIETATDSGLWKNVTDNGTGPWTADGIHPSAIGHAALAALITPSAFA